MLSQNTLDLAKQGNPDAIATLLNYHLSQQFNTVASAIRLGNYLSVLIDSAFAADQTILVERVLTILQDLNLESISTIELSARRMGNQEVLWSQTIEVTTNSYRLIMNPDISSETSAIDATATPSPRSETATNPDWTSLANLLQRPETVALVAFALIVILWENYVEWMEEDDINTPITGIKLARRLGISGSTLSRNKQRSNFSEWSQELDPDGIAWMFEGKGFLPKFN